LNITTHNRYKNHPNPDSCKNDDKLLHAQIFRLNGCIRQVNSNLNTKSPEFTSDLRTKRTSWFETEVNTIADGFAEIYGVKMLLCESQNLIYLPVYIQQVAVMNSDNFQSQY
jgi:hypothetical protein